MSDPPRLCKAHGHHGADRHFVKLDVHAHQRLPDGTVELLVVWRGEPLRDREGNTSIRVAPERVLTPPDGDPADLRAMPLGSVAPLLLPVDLAATWVDELRTRGECVDSYRLESDGYLQRTTVFPRGISVVWSPTVEAGERALAEGRRMLGQWAVYRCTCGHVRFGGLACGHCNLSLDHFEIQRQAESAGSTPEEP